MYRCGKPPPSTDWLITTCSNSELCCLHASFSLARLHYDQDAGIATYQPRPSSHSNMPAPAPQRFSPLDALAPDRSYPGQRAAGRALLRLLQFVRRGVHGCGSRIYGKEKYDETFVDPERFRGTN
jgi:hypothetical protein